MRRAELRNSNVSEEASKNAGYKREGSRVRTSQDGLYEETHPATTVLTTSGTSPC